MSIGKVYLVGAGPGDPDLITRKGLRLLQAADVVIYDRLIPPELLGETRTDVELIDAGKQPTKHRLSQEDINATLLDRALKGKMVVRLKGGDPLLFGRGGEEALACHDHGIYFEIVPGISSAFAAPAYAGIPLTHRHLSSSVTVITGHEDPTKSESSINYCGVGHDWRHDSHPDGCQAAARNRRPASSTWIAWGDTGRDHRMGHCTATALFCRHPGNHRRHCPGESGAATRDHGDRRCGAAA